MGRGLLGASLPDMEEPCMLWRMISPGRWSICLHEDEPPMLWVEVMTPCQYMETVSLVLVCLFPVMLCVCEQDHKQGSFQERLV
jgi:hypothetical protein